MANTYYKGFSTYIIYDEETSYGAGGTPASANNLGKVESVTINVNNNQVLIHGLGDGANATEVVQGGLDVTGTIEIQVNNFDVFQYVLGTKVGVGTSGGAPFEIVERDIIGFAGATETPSLVLEVGSEGGATDDVWTLRGVVFNSITLNMAVDEVITATIEFTASTWAKSASLASITVDTKKPFVFMDLKAQRSTTAWFGVTSMNVTVNANPFIFRDLGAQTREIQCPARGIRRYEWEMVIKKSLATAKEGYGRVIDDLGSATDAPTAGSGTTKVTMRVDGDDGSGSGSKHFSMFLENSTFNTLDEPIEVEDGITEVTIGGTALNGTTGIASASDNTWIQYHTVP